MCASDKNKLTGMDNLYQVQQERICDTVYQLLRDLIIQKVVAPGEKLNMEELASRMRVSRTPVHIALSRLAEEGLVEMIPRKGTFVSRLTKTDIAETFDIRRALELLAAETVVEKATPENLARMTEMAGQTAQPIQTDKQIGRHIQNNNDFHEFFVLVSGNSKLIELYQSLNTFLKIARVHRSSSSWKERLIKEQEEHTLILDAIRKKDLPALKKAIEDHIIRAKKSLLEDIAEME
jgi:DNA-binding GntR family transcriptional regulator